MGRSCRFPGRRSGLSLWVPVAAAIAGLSAAAYFEKAAALMAHDGYPAPEDRPMLQTVAEIGVAPGQTFDLEKISPLKRRGLENAVWFVKCFFHSRAPGSQGDFDPSGCPKRLLGVLNRLSDRAADVKNGWDIRLNIGTYGTNYTVRAVVALVGFGANLPEDAVYPSTSIDADGRPLNGGSRYALHFNESGIPPADVFWSLTMYDSHGFLIENELNRFAVRSLSKLSYNADGSMDIWIQRNNPGEKLESNWLPAPPGDFKLMLRLYGPRPEVLSDNWAPPGVSRIGNTP